MPNSPLFIISMALSDIDQAIVQESKFFKNIVSLIPQSCLVDEVDYGSDSVSDSESDVENDLDDEENSVQPKSEKAKQRAAKKRKRDVSRSQNGDEKCDGPFKQPLSASHMAKRRKREDSIGDDDDSSIKSSLESLDDLNERLHAKIEALKAKRGGSNKSKVDKKQKKRDKPKQRQMSQIKQWNQAKPRTDDAIETSTSGDAASSQDNGSIIFSKFDLLDQDSQRKAHPLAGKDYKRLLQKVNHHQEKLHQIREKNEEKADRLEAKNAWDKAVMKAQGEKVKDDPTLLKKAVKRKEKLKHKSEKKWKELKEKEDERKQARQKKRAANIKKKAQNRIDKKVKKGKKKGHVLGF